MPSSAPARPDWDSKRGRLSVIEHALRAERDRAVVRLRDPPDEVAFLLGSERVSEGRLPCMDTGKQMGRRPSAEESEHRYRKPEDPEERIHHQIARSSSREKPSAKRPGSPATARGGCARSGRGLCARHVGYNKPHG